MNLGFDDLFVSAARPSSSAGFPFLLPPSLGITPIGELHCSTATVDGHGRLSDRSAIKVIGWGPGQCVSIEVDECFVVVTPARASRWAVRSDGYLRLPAAVRHSCNLSTGDRVLIAAASAHDRLLVYPTSVVAAALWAYRPVIWRRAS